MKLENQELVWYNRITIFHHAHYLCSKKYKQRHYTLGLPSVSLAAISGTAIFASLESSEDALWKIIAGALALTAAILSALVTFLSYKERSDAHHKAGALYGNLRADIEYFAKFGEEAKEADFWKTIITKWNKYDTECPLIPNTIYEKARNEVTAFRKRSISLP